MTSPCPLRTSRTKQSPPMPVCVGSTTPRSATAAIAASIALPPRRSTSSAVKVANGCEVAAMASVPNASDRPGRSKSRIGLENRKARVPQIRDQHRGWRVGNAQGRFGIMDGELRGQAARPKHRQLVLGDLSVPHVLVAALQVDADILRPAYMHGRAMHIGETRGDLNSADRI